MLTSSEIISLFNTAQKTYAPIVGPPTDNNMVQLCENILTILYSISLGANAVCPSQLILTDAAYKRLLGTNVVFDYIIGSYKSYDPSIEDDATDGLRKNMEQEWIAWIATQLLIRACKMGCWYFILKVVKDTWVQRL